MGGDGGPWVARADDSAPVTITDAAGITHTLKHLPERVVVVGSAPYMPLHMLYMFPETQTRLVGYERKFKTAEEFLPLVDPVLENKTVLSANPGPEQIAAWNPEKIFMIVWFRLSGRDVLDSLKKNGNGACSRRWPPVNFTCFRKTFSDGIRPTPAGYWECCGWPPKFIPMSFQILTCATRCFGFSGNSTGCPRRSLNRN